MTPYVLLPLLCTVAIEGLTPWSRVLFEKLIVSQLVKKFLAFKKNRQFISAFITARHLPHSRPDQSTPYLHLTS